MYDEDAGGISERRRAMEMSALGFTEERLLSAAAARSSSRMARDWTSAVGSTGSLISSWTWRGVRGVSMLRASDVDGDITDSGDDAVKALSDGMLL